MLGSLLELYNNIRRLRDICAIIYQTVSKITYKYINFENFCCRIKNSFEKSERDPHLGKQFSYSDIYTSEMFLPKEGTQFDIVRNLINPRALAGIAATRKMP